MRRSNSDKGLKMKKNILVVAAHPDDEVLGCGGTMTRLIEEGFDVYIAILGEGVTSRDEKPDRTKRIKAITQLRQDSHKADTVIGAKKVFFHNFPDNRFDTVPLLDITKHVERIKKEIAPSIVYTHHRRDLNIDHRVVYYAVLTACRPMKSETVKEIYSFEVPSSTEWNFPNTFNPNLFIDITGTIERKIKAMNIYKSEIKPYPHPRSEEAVRSIARRWGSLVGVNYAEAFEVIRISR